MKIICKNCGSEVSVSASMKVMPEHMRADGTDCPRLCLTWGGDQEVRQTGDNTPEDHRCCPPSSHSSGDRPKTGSSSRSLMGGER